MHSLCGFVIRHEWIWTDMNGYEPIVYTPASHYYLEETHAPNKYDRRYELLRCSRIGIMTRRCRATHDGNRCLLTGSKLGEQLKASARPKLLKF